MFQTRVFMLPCGATEGKSSHPFTSTPSKAALLFFQNNF